MENEKMTIHRALSELKLIDSRILKTISELEPVSANQKNKKVAGYLTEEEFTINANAAWQSINDLIKRKTQIKSAIVASNAKTVIKHVGMEFFCSGRHHL